MSIETFSIVGSGNVAYHMAKMLSGQFRLLSIHSRNRLEGKKLAEKNFAYYAESIEDLLESDLTIVCVSDDQIAAVVSALPAEQSVAYTSGSIALNDLPHRENLGVIYPLQTFTKGEEMDYFNLPFFIEANNESFAQALFDLAWQFSRQVVFLSSADRLKLHVAAVMVNNFVNHIFQLSEDFLRHNAIEFKYLYPLILETAKKATLYSPGKIQTGPAKRGDEKTMAMHQTLLDSEMAEIYRLLSKSIQRTHN